MKYLLRRLYCAARGPFATDLYDYIKLFPGFNKRLDGTDPARFDTWLKDLERAKGAVNLMKDTAAYRRGERKPLPDELAQPFKPSKRLQEQQQ